MVTEVFLPHLNTKVKLGRTRPAALGPRLSFSNYLRKSMPPIPATCNYAPVARNTLSQVYLNDQLGDCVIAAMAHVVGLITANAGGPEIQFTDQQLVTLYSTIGGYVPGNPATDRGCSIQDALNYWTQSGAPAGAHRLISWLAVNPHNPQEYRTALWLFENLIYGAGLPDSWLNGPRPGFVWDAGRPNPNNGHAFVGVGYDAPGSPPGVQIATWGMLGTLTDAAHAADIDELYVALSPEIINQSQAKAPNGLNWSQLVADFNALGGNVPVPPPPPGPSPGPGPVPVPPPVPPPPIDVRAFVDGIFKDLLAAGHSSSFQKEIAAVRIQFAHWLTAHHY